MLDISSDRDEKSELEDENLDSLYDKRLYFIESPTDLQFGSTMLQESDELSKSTLDFKAKIYE